MNVSEIRNLISAADDLALAEARRDLTREQEQERAGVLDALAMLEGRPDVEADLATHARAVAAIEQEEAEVVSVLGDVKRRAVELRAAGEVIEERARRLRRAEVKVSRYIEQIERQAAQAVGGASLVKRLAAVRS